MQKVRLTSEAQEAFKSWYDTVDSLPDNDHHLIGAKSIADGTEALVKEFVAHIASKPESHLKQVAEYLETRGMDIGASLRSLMVDAVMEPTQTDKEIHEQLQHLNKVLVIGTKAKDDVSLNIDIKTDITSSIDLIKKTAEELRLVESLFLGAGEKLEKKIKHARNKNYSTKEFESLKREHETVASVVDANLAQISELLRVTKDKISHLNSNIHRVI
jgi:uncharacterized protein (DUF2132 family)